MQIRGEKAFAAEKKKKKKKNWRRRIDIKIVLNTISPLKPSPLHLIE